MGNCFVCLDVERELREQISRLRFENQEMEASLQDRNRENAMLQQRVELAERKLRDLQGKYEEMKKDYENTAKMLIKRSEGNLVEDYAEVDAAVTEKLQNQNDIMHQMREEIEALNEHLAIQRTAVSPIAASSAAVPQNIRKNPFDSDVEDGFAFGNPVVNHQLVQIDNPTVAIQQTANINSPVADKSLGFEDSFVKNQPDTIAPNVDFQLIDITNFSEEIKQKYLDESLKKIQEIKKHTDILKLQVDDFKGTDKDKVYLHLEETLIKNLIALDKIESHNIKKIGEERKNALLKVQECLEVLKSGIS